MDRTYVVTGAASGIGAATARYLRERGDRVIACDLHNADVIADLTTIEGRAELVDGVTRLSGGKIDAIVANAGENAARSFREFFASTIHNKNTRTAYLYAVNRFFAWCEHHKPGRLADIRRGVLRTVVGAHSHGHPLKRPAR